VSEATEGADRGEDEMRHAGGHRFAAIFAATLFLGLGASLALNGAVLAGSGAPVPDRPGTSTACIGTVTDAAHHPLKSALVSAQRNGTGETTIVITDADGQFRMPPLAPGRYEIAVNKPGFASQAITASFPAARALRVALKSLPVVALAQLRDSDIIRYMPDDDPARTANGGGGGVHVALADQSAKTLVRDRCVRCHTLALVMRQGRTREEWEAVVTRMGTYPIGAPNPVGYALTGKPELRKRIIDYLAKYVGPESGTAAAIEQSATRGYHEEVPLGAGVVYTEWKLPTPLAMGHTAVPDRSGHVWISEYAASSIARFDIATQTFVEYPVRKPHGNPHGINVGADGVVWYTIDGDLGRIDPKTGTVEEFRPPKDQPVGLNVIIARNGIVWYATPGGAGRFDPVTKEFGRLVAEPGMGSPYALIQSRQNDDVLWFCVEEQDKVGFVNVRTGEAKVWHTALPGPKRPRVDSQGRVWFGYYEGGAIGMVDPVTMQLTDFPLPYRGSAYAIHVDDHDDVWAASYERGSLIRLDAKTHALTEYPWPSPGGIVRDIWPDAEGNLWYVHFAWTHNVLVRAERPPLPAVTALRAAN
jgi:virginiamycin B lyase